MTIGFRYILLIVAGLGGILWGVPAAHRLRKPLDIGAAFVVLCGVILFAFGILLTCIPRFFQG